MAAAGAAGLWRRAAATLRRWRREDAITPVVGTSMILVITVLGMAAVLFWGTPTLQRIQDRGSIVGMEGEFDELRRASLELSVPDASRVPTVSLEDGALSLEDGTRVMVAVAHDATQADCDWYVEGWETSPSTVLDVRGTDCRTATDHVGLGACAVCVEVERVTGSSTVPLTQVSFATVGAQHYRVTYTGIDPDFDFADGDWAVRLTDGGDTAYASAWLVDQKRVSWRLSTSVSDVSLHLEGGAVFVVDSGSFFLHRPPAIREQAFGSSDHVVRLVTLLGPDSGSSGRSTPEVFLGLVGNHVRLSTTDATQLRYAFSGDVAEAWCQSLLIRNDALPSDQQYALPGAGTCQDATPHVVYQHLNPTPQPFPLEFLHVRITSSIQA